MKLLRSNYDERKLAFQKLIHTMQQWFVEPPTTREVARFQQDALQLIALYVRDHRYDLKRKQIFVNLMVQRGEQVVVIRRADPETRPVPQAYASHECTLVWEAIRGRRAQVTGDVYEQFPGTRPNKPYNSIIVLPVFLGARVVGAVSIDSEAKYHFDRYFEELQTALAPYVQLLATTLSEDHDTGVPEAP
jgi:hypothetical protein